MQIEQQLIAKSKNKLVWNSHDVRVYIDNDD